MLIDFNRAGVEVKDLLIHYLNDPDLFLYSGRRGGLIKTTLVKVKILLYNGQKPAELFTAGIRKKIPREGD